MTKNLTKQDIKDLRYQCRMGYIIPFFIFLLGSTVTIIFYESYFKHEITKTLAYSFIGLTYAISASVISHRMNRKYYQDIQNNQKVAVLKTLQRKTSKRDFEAGSGNMTTLPHNNPMNEFIRYDFIIDNTIYRVKKELFESCSDGDQVYFYIAPKSKFHLSIEKE